ncbi:MULTISPECIES: dTDP-4-dehydrorhamnose 3,5-epimerase [Flavobacteriaceae]|uniref:dTDP-4-dehydrorhamnose 3,5-epimerase n=1 Tax=Flavobacteriaceae TaxID=49546 RepID=UPI00149159A9|nr:MULTISPECIES: dTDP-4-dehydrorhamnose 3,5-epimerase [Allomuricauda]MDC6365653.1 dTDP-4-dehydrorhamnose 3,5-epimerase [Muricauda sp. AC10]
MDVLETNIDGCFELIPRVFEDERGYFFESYNQEKFERTTGAKPYFVQDNQSFSTKGVLRGLHFQKGRHAQAKLVRVLEGEVLDVAVDLRENSKTYGNIVRTVLSSSNKKQLYIPRGCAHGFVTLSKTALFFYKCDNFYNKDSEAGIVYDDPSLNIDWILDKDELIISEKDQVLSTLEKFALTLKKE